MYQDPAPPPPRREMVFPKELIPLWLQALARPEADMKRLAAAHITLARRRGMSGLEATVSPLLEAFHAPVQHSSVRLAVARALIALDTRAAAEPLFRAAQAGGIDLRNLVEPALANWDYTPARNLWLARLEQPAEPRQSVLLALNALGAVRESRAADRLRELTLAPLTEPMLRVAAARSLGLVRTTGSERDAERLLAEKGPVTHLAATLILRLHRSNGAIDLLKRLALDAEPAVALAAFEALYEADPRLAAALAPSAAASPDATVRARVVEAMRKCPAPPYISVLAELTNDPHPDVRTEARKALRELARRLPYDGLVRREATRMLATANWRALEQTIILLTQLDHKPAGARFIELLRFDRPEVFVTAAWGLRKLALAQHLAALQRTIEWQLEPSSRAQTAVQAMAIDLQVAQLAQALGQARYRPAEPLLRRFIARGFGPGNEARAAAIWALGFIHRDTPPPELVEHLIERMLDLHSLDPEDWRVVQMSAASLGRMKARLAEATLRSFYKGELSQNTLSNVSGWALQQITGEPLQPGVPVRLTQHGWFLEPAD